MPVAKYYHDVRDGDRGGKCSTFGIRETRTVVLSGDMNETYSLVDVSVDGLLVL